MPVPTEPPFDPYPSAVDVTAAPREPFVTARELGRTLSSRRSFTPRWVARLVELAMRSGYETGRAEVLAEQTELNLAALAGAYATPGFSAADTQQEISRRAARLAADTVGPRPGDYHGGAIPVWDPDPRRAAHAEALNARIAALPRVPNPGRRQA